MEITFDHSYTAPYYSILLRNITGVVGSRATSLDYDAISAVPYGNYMIFNVTYLDVDASPSVGVDSAQIYLLKSGEQLNLGVDFWCQYAGNGIYTINVSTVALGAPETYSLEIITNSTADWWLLEKSRSIAARVLYRLTQLTYDVSGEAPYLDNVSITLTFEDIDTSTGIAGASFVLTIGTTLTEGTDYWIDALSDGVYNVLVNSTVLGLGAFSIEIRAEWSGVPFYQNRTVDVPVQVRKRATMLTYDPPIETPFGNNLTITLRYYDVDAGLVGIPDAQSQFTLDTINSTSVDSSYYWVEYVSGATYRLILNTTKLDV